MLYFYQVISITIEEEDFVVYWKKYRTSEKNVLWALFEWNEFANNL
jgi:hypothetical protein